MTFLEESDGTVEIHVDGDALDSIDMKCRGGKEEHLCPILIPLPRLPLLQFIQKM